MWFFCLNPPQTTYIKNVNEKTVIKMAKKKENGKEELKESELEPEEENLESKELSELEKAQALAEDYKRKWYAVSAEYDNYRKRNQTAVSQAYANGASEAVLKLLSVADNFGYALDSASDEKTKAGIDKVIKSFLTILGSLGVEQIAVNAGDKFDESVMEAVLDFPCEEGEEPNTVKQILKQGYRLKDGKVIRFAQVAVTI